MFLPGAADEFIYFEHGLQDEPINFGSPAFRRFCGSVQTDAATVSVPKDNRFRDMFGM